MFIDGFNCDIDPILKLLVESYKILPIVGITEIPDSNEYVSRGDIQRGGFCDLVAGYFGVLLGQKLVKFIGANC